MDTAGSSKLKNVAGSTLSIVPSLMFLMGIIMALTINPEAVQGTMQYGFSLNTLVPLGILELICVVLYLVLPTAVLGFILLTAYLGGAVAIHLRLGEWNMMLVPVIVSIVFWLGIYLREPRLADLLPIRRRTR